MNAHWAQSLVSNTEKPENEVTLFCSASAGRTMQSENTPYPVTVRGRDRFLLGGQGELPGRMSERECSEGPGLLKAEIGRIV